MPEVPKVPETPPPTPKNPGIPRASFFPNLGHSYVAQTKAQTSSNVEMATSPDNSGIIAGGSFDDVAQTSSSLSENRQGVEMVTSTGNLLFDISL